MNVVVYLPSNFYASVGSFVAEFFLALNWVRGRPHFCLKFVSKRKDAVTRSGIRFPTDRLDSRRIDLLIFLAGHSFSLLNLERELAEEVGFAKQIIRRAVRDNAVIAGTCTASLLMAKAGLLNQRRATISWWAASEAKQLFPQVRWESQRIVNRDKGIYTSGGVYAVMDLLTELLADMGYAGDVRTVRKLLVSPPVRQVQSPYEMDARVRPKTEFEKRLDQCVRKIGIGTIDTTSIAIELGMTPKTLSRRFRAGLSVSPGKWLQMRRIATAKELLESSTLTVGEICYKVGYDDQASFTRLFSRVAGLTPGEYRRHMQL